MTGLSKNSLDFPKWRATADHDGHMGRKGTALSGPETVSRKDQST